MKTLTASWGVVMMAAAFVIYPIYHEQTRQPTPRMNEATIAKAVTQQLQAKHQINRNHDLNQHQLKTDKQLRGGEAN